MDDTEKVLNASKGIPEIFKTVQKSFMKSFHEALANFTEQRARIVETIRNEFAERFPKEIQPIISALADRGWFISGEAGFSSLLELKDFLDQEHAEIIDLKMADWISESIPSIERSLAEDFPERLPFLSAAIRAHSDKEYELSVPIFLIQAEGICLDLLKVKLFSSSSGVPITKKAINKLEINPFTKSMLFPLLEGSGITASEHERHKYPTCLNRHEILHGIDVKYANRMNSLKALSLIWFLCTILSDVISKSHKEYK